MKIKEHAANKEHNEVVDDRDCSPLQHTQAPITSEVVILRNFQLLLSIGYLEKQDPEIS